ncbi:DUF4112 domain-containing protein [Aureimonas phyllosphaerae]|uniref:DUF4112 domain-containing protein n=1 Tax=Aureimonas phyllosphaerae TaxID=1166078 RepID=A0A7W6BTX2_9HYPH|nr:DUF4112 domain-containing protein [Aureimonas phyllosphaerae]MBB3934993.1 hypothetical protein [Aureimonas phyllosphaerae]MBB3959001.1 hypothetical protein [Aureimonas phyllosphaerae]SFF39987.1 protein of unknown function [Aureimonas phyllosphaerae]
MTAFADTGTVWAEDRERRIARLNALARLMDTAIRVPGTGIRFGADALLGLVPGIGDAGGALIGLFIVNEARRLGLPKRKLARMVGNLGVDAMFGAVPLAGDVFDVYFKAHKRNIGIILDHFDMRRADIRDVTPERR